MVPDDPENSLSGSTNRLKPLLASHLNSKAANISLFEETGCRSLLNGFADGPKVAFDLQTVKIFDVLSPEDVWDPSPAAVFPFDKTFDDLSSEPFLVSVFSNTIS